MGIELYMYPTEGYSNIHEGEYPEPFNLYWLQSRFACYSVKRIIDYFIYYFFIFLL